MIFQKIGLYLTASGQLIQKIILRNPKSYSRPWQLCNGCMQGYLLLQKTLFKPYKEVLQAHGIFGPKKNDLKVLDLAFKFREISQKKFKK